MATSDPPNSNFATTCEPRTKTTSALRIPSSSEKTANVCIARIIPTRRRRTSTWRKRRESERGSIDRSLTS